MTHLEVLGILSVLHAVGAKGAPRPVREESVRSPLLPDHNRGVRVRLSDISRRLSERGAPGHEPVWLASQRVDRCAWCVAPLVAPTTDDLCTTRRYAQWAATMQDRRHVVATAADDRGL